MCILLIQSFFDWLIDLFNYSITKLNSDITELFYKLLLRDDNVP